MSPVQNSFFHAVISLLVLFSASHANATVFSLNGTFNVSLVRGADLTGLVNTGDKVYVEAFYDTDLNVMLDGSSTTSASYGFPAGSVGVRYTVNDLTWGTTGPLTVTVTPVDQIFFHSDGSVAATYGGPGWESSSIETPFGAESGSGIFILYLPQFSTALIPNTNLPTDLTVNQLAGPDFVHGAVASLGPNGDYFFNFTSPVPEPGTYALMLAGMGMMGFIARSKRAEHNRGRKIQSA